MTTKRRPVKGFRFVTTLDRAIAAERHRREDARVKDVIAVFLSHGGCALPDGPQRNERNVKLLAILRDIETNGI